MMPGMTTRPSASTVRRAPERRPMSVTRPSRMPTSARRMGRPEPSTTVPPLMMVSNAVIDILRSRSCHPPDVLELAVRPERPLAADTADTGELVAAERGVGVERAAVDLHRPGPHGARDAQPAGGVAGPDVAVEPVVGVVGERDRLGLVAERDRGDHRPEDLLARDRHVVARAGEERRLHVIAPSEVRRAAAASLTRRPTAVLPVNEIMSTSGERTRASPISGPLPFTKFSTPGGRNASTIRQSSATPRGSTGDGFTTTVLPQASAGPIFPAQFVIGKLKGVMQATTPTGSQTITPAARARPVSRGG